MNKGFVLNILWTQEHQKHLSTHVDLIQDFRSFSRLSKNHVYFTQMTKQSGN